MIRSRLLACIFCAGLVLIACGPASPSRPGTDGERPGAAAAPKTLSIAVGGEPENMIMTIGGGSKTIADHIRLAVHQTLVTYDERGEPVPLLATELPSPTGGTWVVRSDGTMQTTYRLHRGVTWHDGQPLTARDLVFGWTVNKDPDIPMSDRLVASQISRIDTPDDHTVVIEWAKLNPFGNAIVSDNLGPLPVHLIQAAYLEDKDRFQQLAWWRREFVGVGPYQLADWEPGSHLTLKAYDRFHAGRAKIDTIVVRFLEAEPTVVANLLAGSLDGAMPGVIDYSQVLFVRSEWERGGKSPMIVTQPSHWRMLSVQFRVPITPELLDARLRRGLLHTLDRQVMVDALFGGQSPVSDTWVHPNDAKYEWVRDVVARYPYDVPRGQALLAEAGWRRGADGVFTSASGERITLPIWTTGGTQSERELAFIADSWKQAGVSAEQFVIPNAQARDNQLRASFPAFEITQQGLSFENMTTRVYGPACPTEATRWTGGNRGCYQNASVDRVVDALQVAIDPAEQRTLYRDYIRMQSEDLPVLPLFFQIRGTVFRDGVMGVKGDTNPPGSTTWNVREWDVRQ